MITVAAMEKIFGPGGLLAQRLAGYRFRPDQLRMAQAVAATLALPAGDRANCLAVEAGTGTGKTLAYLVPAVLSGQQIVVATATRNLQDQILERDIPFIRRHLARDLTATVLKGRQNYLCRHRFHQFLAAPQQQLFDRPEAWERLRRWAETTEIGDRAEVSWLADDHPLWREVTVAGHQCLGSDCPEAADCCITRARQRAARSQLVIVNHHLFFSDLAVRRTGGGEVLPRYESVIFDEAHHLEDIAGQYFGHAFSLYQLLDLAADLEREAKGRDPSCQRSTAAVAMTLRSQGQRLLALFPEERAGRQPLAVLAETVPAWPEIVEETECFLGRAEDHATAQGWPGLAGRAATLAEDLRRVAGLDDPDYVYWYERRQRTVTLAATPISVAAELDEFYHETRAAVFASATLTVDGSFAYFFRRMGLAEETDHLVLDSPFAYETNTLCYVVPDTFPPPQAEAFGPAAGETLCRLLAASRGRALVLFTAVTAMRRAAGYLAGRLPFPLLVQGEAPRNLLLERFQRDTHSVLLAVASFWEGVDVPGESLSLVVIDKLPFEVPSDPVLQARLARVEAEGGSPFFDLQVPRAILALRQGVGRLLRRESDRGVIAILDNRLFTKGYGKRIRRSLPPFPICRELTAVEAFFAADENHPLAPGGALGYSGRP